MTKAEIKSAIDANGGIKRERVPNEAYQSSIWDEAFKQYNADNKHNQLKKSNCGACFRKVYEWLCR